MKKNFRKVPDWILQKIENIVSNNITVATVIRLMASELEDPTYTDIHFSVNDGTLTFNEEYIPSKNKGSYSKKNILGYKIKYPERSRIPKTYYLGERHKYGDNTRETFSLYVTRQVIDYDEIPPKEISIIVELLNSEEENGQIFYIFKISTSQILSKQSDNFIQDVLFNINLLQENIGSINVYGIDATVNDYLQTLQVNWEIFPPGEQDEDLARITIGMRNLTPQRMGEIQERYTFLRNENPIRFITGNSGMRRYFGAKFSEQLVVFENITYGNALYILFENWEELSQLSRIEIQSRSSDQFIRVKHSGNWQDRIKAIIQAKR